MKQKNGRMKGNLHIYKTLTGKIIYMIIRIVNFLPITFKDCLINHVRMRQDCAETGLYCSGDLIMTNYCRFLLRKTELVAHLSYIWSVKINLYFLCCNVLS